MHKSTGAPQSPEKIEVFEKREGTQTADLLINALPYEDAGVSVAETEESEHRINGCKLPRSARWSIEQQAEVAAYNLFILKRSVNFI
jgi:hypothetical protein